MQKSAGVQVSQLTPKEQQAHRRYRRRLYARRKASMSDEEREAQRARWRQRNKG